MTDERQLPPVNAPFGVPGPGGQALPPPVPGERLDPQDPLVPPAPAQDHPSGKDSPVVAGDADDDDLYEYVRVGGKVRAVLKSSIVDEPETATQAVPKAAMVEVVDPHFYVHLADGKVIRVKQSDLPASAGTNAGYGHWQIDDKVFVIIGVYPVEDIVKGEKA